MIRSLALSLMLSVLGASSLVSSHSAWSAPHGRSMIEIGAGAASLGDTTPIEALIRVRAESSSGNGVLLADRLVVIKIEADGTIGSEGVRYIDFDFEAFTNEWTGRNKYTYLGIAGITGSFDRNLPINQNMTLSLNFLGLRGGIGGRISPDVVAYLHGAVDLLGIAYSERLTDGEANTGYYNRFELEGGLTIKKRFRIALGYELQTVNNEPYTYQTGNYSCSTYGRGSSNGYSSSGVSFTSCSPDEATDYLETRELSRARLSLIADLTKQLSLFGHAQYTVYSVLSETGKFTGSIDSTVQFFLGVNYQY